MNFYEACPVQLKLVSKRKSRQRSNERRNLISIKNVRVKRRKSKKMEDKKLYRHIESEVNKC